MGIGRLYDRFPLLTQLQPQKREQLNWYFASAPDWLIDCCSVMTLSPGTFFTRQGEPCHTVFYVVSGLYRAIDYITVGVEYVFETFSKVYSSGGMEVLMEMDTYGTTLQTIEECIVLKIPRSQFEAWMKTDITALGKEARMMGEYLLRQAELAREYLFLPGVERLAKVLIQHYERNADGGILKLVLSRQELADEAAFGIKTVSRALTTLSSKGLITRNERYISISYEQYLRMKAMLSSE